MLFPAIVLAEGPVSAKTDLGAFANVGQFVAALIDKYAVPFAVIAALLIIVFAGFEYITSGGAPEALTKSKEMIVGAVLGLLTVFLIGWFLQSIIPEDELKDAGSAPSSSTGVAVAPDPNTDPLGYLNYEKVKLSERVESAGKSSSPPLKASFTTESGAITELTTKITGIHNNTKLSDSQKIAEIKKLKPTIEKLMGAIQTESATQQKLLGSAIN